VLPSAVSTSAPVNETISSATAVESITPLPSAPPAAATVATSSHRQWASASRGRHTTAASRRRSHTAEASSEISALAQAQTAYYKRQLEIAELQHEMFVAQHSQTMAKLALQQKYIAAKLRKIGEE